MHSNLTSRMRIRQNVRHIVNEQVQLHLVYTYGIAKITAKGLVHKFVQH